MKFQTLSFAILMTFCLYPSCKDKCSCRDLEDCVDGECVLKENSFYLNNQGFQGTNLYHGVVKGNSCIDTLILDVNLLESNPAYRFILIAKVPPYGAYNVSPTVISEISNTEFLLGSGSPICNQNSTVYWYASYIHCYLFKDSVQMNIKFRSSNGLPTPDFVDSCKVTLVK